MALKCINKQLLRPRNRRIGVLAKSHRKRYQENMYFLNKIPPPRVHSIRLENGTPEASVFLPANPLPRSVCKASDLRHNYVTP